MPTVPSLKHSQAASHLVTQSPKPRPRPRRGPGVRPRQGGPANLSGSRQSGIDGDIPLHPSWTLPPRSSRSTKYLQQTLPSPDSETSQRHPRDSPQIAEGVLAKAILLNLTSGLAIGPLPTSWPPGLSLPPALWTPQSSSANTMFHDSIRSPARDSHLLCSVRRQSTTSTDQDLLSGPPPRSESG